MHIRLLFLFLLINSTTVHAGGWPPPQWISFFKISEWWIVSDKHFDRQGNIQPNLAEYGYYSTNLYAEFNLARQLTGIVNFPFLCYSYRFLPTSMVKQSAWKLGESEIGLKYSFTKDNPIDISSSLILGLPNATNQYTDLPTGDGEFNQIIRIDAKKSIQLFKTKGWLNIYGAYNNRTREYANEIQYGLAGSVQTTNEKLALIVRLDGVDALGDPVNATNINPESLFSNYKE